MPAGSAAISASGRLPFIAIQQAPGASRLRLRFVKSVNEANAREVMRSKGFTASASTRACAACKFCNPSVPAACLMKAAFLPTESTQVTSNAGSMIASSTPGKPPPLPTSSSRPRAATYCTGRTTARQSARCCVSMAGRSRTAVRL